MDEIHSSTICFRLIHRWDLFFFYNDLFGKEKSLVLGWLFFFWHHPNYQKYPEELLFGNCISTNDHFYDKYRKNLWHNLNLCCGDTHFVQNDSCAQLNRNIFLHRLWIRVLGYRETKKKTTKNSDKELRLKIRTIKIIYFTGRYTFSISAIQSIFGNSLTTIMICVKERFVSLRAVLRNWEDPPLYKHIFIKVTWLENLISITEKLRVGWTLI